MNALDTGRTLAQRRNELAAIFQKHNTGEYDSTTGAPIYVFPDGVETEIAKRQDEVAQLQDQYEKLSRAEMDKKNREALADLNQIRQRTPLGGGDPMAIAGKSLGERVVQDFVYKNRKAAPKGHFTVDFPEVDLKTLLTTAGTPGFPPANNRTDMIVPFPNRPIRVPDIIPSVNTDLSVVKWIEETSFTNNASMTGEGYTKQESAVDYDEINSPVRKVATWLPVTEEQVDDVPGFMALINNDLTLMLRLKEEDQLINGTGVGQELTGFLNKSNIQTQAFVTNNADTIHKAITLVAWTGYANATGIVMNPTNWETTRLIKGATNQDYVLGSPLIEITPRLWGVPVIVTNVIAAGTALVGDFQMFSTVFRKMGIRIDVSDSHSTYFVENKLAVRAEERLALVIKRGTAFVKVTNLT